MNPRKLARYEDERLYKKLHNSMEMVSLFSLAYNAPRLIGNHLVGALREGNRAKVQYKILYGSNKNRDVVLDSRREREARQFGQYDAETPTAEELKAEEEVKVAHSADIALYDSQMDGKRKRKSAKRASGTKTALNTHTKRHKAGAVPNQNEVRKRTDEVKAHSRNQGHTILERMMDLFGGHDRVTYQDWSNHPAGFDDRHYHKRWS